jgi:hypothetical protein
MIHLESLRYEVTFNGIGDGCSTSAASILTGQIGSSYEIVSQKIKGRWHRR